MLSSSGESADLPQRLQDIARFDLSDIGQFGFHGTEEFYEDNEERLAAIVDDYDAFTHGSSIGKRAREHKKEKTGGVVKPRGRPRKYPLPTEAESSGPKKKGQARKPPGADEGSVAQVGRSAELPAPPKTKRRRGRENPDNQPQDSPRKRRKVAPKAQPAHAVPINMGDSTLTSMSTAAPTEVDLAMPVESPTLHPTPSARILPQRANRSSASTVRNPICATTVYSPRRTVH